ncbi:DUF1775 domain-containing protein, partial [Rhizobium johnstonii]|uniref:DUF1775 domain-containing protein n=1 Tax=Rhizobium johnstonii TaxID=3019933 RepID=UPI003F9C3E76
MPTTPTTRPVIPSTRARTSGCEAASDASEASSCSSASAVEPWPCSSPVAAVTTIDGAGCSGSSPLSGVGSFHSTTPASQVCDGSPTTTIAIDIPDSIISVTPTVNAGWDVSTVMT